MSKLSLEEYIAASPGLTVEAVETLADYAGVGLINWHIPSGEIKLNRNITLLAGYEPGDLPHTGNTREMLTYEEDRALVNENIQSILSGEKDRYRIEYRMRRSDGSLVWVSENAIVYQRDKNGKPIRLAAMALELTRLKWAEEKAREMEKEVKRLSSEARDIDLAEQNRMLRAANSASNIIIGGFHHDYEIVLRQSLQILADSIQAQRAYMFRNTMVDGKLCCFPRVEWYLQCPSGREQGVEHALVYDEFLPNWKEIIPKNLSVRMKIKDLDREILNIPNLDDVNEVMIIPLFLQGEFWGFIGFDDTVSDRGFSENEAEIMRAGAMVIASSITRNETFSKLNKSRMEAMASTKAKGEFLSRMSHEIRTPMNAIIGMSSIAKKTKDLQKIQSCMERIDASSRQLLNIINDVLDISKIDSGKFDIVSHPFDFEQMMGNVVNVVQVKIEEKSQKLHFDFDMVFKNKMIGDELRLSQVLINLLNNATKFTPDYGEITLKVSEAFSETEETKKTKETEETEETNIQIEVIDTGIGISEDHQARLFQSFEQADGSITRQYGGSGLGLAICKKIVHLMGGNIWVESEEGKGSCFAFTFPVRWGDPIAEGAPLKKGAPASRILVGDDIAGLGGDELIPFEDKETAKQNWQEKTILLAEDIEINREIVISILEETGVSLICAENGQLAVDLFAENPEKYDLILMDMQMPVLDGICATKKIRALEHPAAKTVPIIAMTANAFKEDEQLCFEAGMNNHLSKPVEIDKFFDVLSDYLGEAEK